MKVLLLFTYNVSLNLWDKLGIIQREILLYKQLIENNTSIIFLTYGDKRDLKILKPSEKIRIIPVYDMIKSRIQKFMFIKSLFLPIKLRNIFKEVDIIKTNQIQGSLIGVLAKLIFKKKIVIRGGYEWLINHIHQPINKSLKNYIRYLIKYFWIFIYELIVYKFADGIILTNENEISFIIKNFKLNKKNKNKKICHIYNYIDTDLFKPLNLPKKDKHVLFIGRLTKIKNLFSLLNAFKDLKDFHLNIIGKGVLEEKLKKYAEKLNINVKFLGLYPNHEIPKIINQHQIFIIPSYKEGNPKALLEAMSCGICCIGTKVWGISNLISHRENGYICDTNPHSIREAILNVYHDHSLRKKLNKNARNYILKNFSLDLIANKEKQFYNYILKKHKDM